MKNSCKSFKQWCHAHPFKLATFVFAFCVIAGLVGEVPDTGLALAAIIYGLLFVVVYIADVKRMGLMSISIAALIAMPSVPAKAQEQPSSGPIQPPLLPMLPVLDPQVGGVIIGVTAIVIGGVAYYYLRSTCQRLFPKPPEKTNALYYASSPADCAASFSYQSPHSCKLPDPSLLEAEQSPVVVEIEIEAGAIREIRRSKTAVVDYADFARALATHGIRPSERPGEEWYGLNGRPAEAPQVPIAFDAADNSVVVGRGLIHKLTVERSADFETWEPMVTTSLADGQRAVVVDASEEQQMFYRVR